MLFRSVHGEALQEHLACIAAAQRVADQPAIDVVAASAMPRCCATHIVDGIAVEPPPKAETLRIDECSLSEIGR